MPDNDQIERAGFFRRHGAVMRGVAGIAMLATVAAACGGGSSSSDDADGDTGTDDAPAEDLSDAEWDLDATLDITLNGPPSELDPHLEPHTGTQSFWTPLYDTLTDAFTDGTPRPNVATEWERSDDGLTWVFTLRDDITFHDGTPLDATAVKLSIERAKDHPDSTVFADLAAIESIEATGEFEVTITTSDYDPKLPAVLGGPAGAILNPTAIEAGNDFSTTPDGSGAYLLTGIVPEQSATYERAEDPYWHPDGGRLAGFTLRYVDDFQSAINGVRSGQYDGSYVLGVSKLVQGALDADDSLARIVYPTPVVEALYLNPNVEGLSDVRVRQAIAYSLDRQSLTDAVFDGGADCRPVSQNYPFENDPLYVDGFDPYPYDVDKANELLVEAGAEGARFTFHNIGATASEFITEGIQPMINAAGFDVLVQQGTQDITQQYRRGEIDGMVVTNVAQAHPLLTLSRYWMPDGAYHAAEGHHEGLQALIDQVNDPSVTEEELDGIYEEISREMARLAVIIPVCADTAHVLAKDNIRGLVESQFNRINMRFVGVLAD